MVEWSAKLGAAVRGKLCSLGFYQGSTCSHSAKRLADVRANYWPERRRPM
jgi:hypothetical protein